MYLSLMSHKLLNAIFELRGPKTRDGKKCPHVDIEQFMCTNVDIEQLMFFLRKA